MDLLLVAETDRPFPERAHEFEDLTDIIPTIDILVYTPAEIARLTTDPSAGFWQTVTATRHRLV